jgi:hypothetical protein
MNETYLREKKEYLEENLEWFLAQDEPEIVTINELRGEIREVEEDIALMTSRCHECTIGYDNAICGDCDHFHEAVMLHKK